MAAGGSSLSRWPLMNRRARRHSMIGGATKWLWVRESGFLSDVQSNSRSGSGRSCLKDAQRDLYTFDSFNFSKHIVSEMRVRTLNRDLEALETKQRASYAASTHC